MTQAHPALDAMSKKYIVKNVWHGRLTISGPGVEAISLNSGEETILSGFQVSTQYSHALKVFQGCKPARVLIAPAESVPEVEKVSTSQDDEIEDEAQAEVEEISEEKAESLQEEIKALSKEYKDKATSLERKQEIKEAIRSKKKALKSRK